MKRFNWNSCNISKLWTYCDNICGYVIKNKKSRLFYLTYDDELYVQDRNGELIEVSSLECNELIAKIKKKAEKQNLNSKIETMHEIIYRQLEYREYNGYSYNSCDMYEEDALLGVDLH